MKRRNSLPSSNQPTQHSITELPITTNGFGIKCLGVACYKANEDEDFVENVNEETKSLNAESRANHKWTEPQRNVLESFSTKNVNFNVDMSLNQSEINDLKSKYPHGFVRLQSPNGIIQNQDGSLYLNFKLEKLKSDASSFKINEQLRDVPRFMSTVWNLKSPQIIIPIITGLTNFKNWRNKKLEEDFHRGLIKAANKAEMWFITNGINGGISAMVGDAFSEERSSRFTESSSGNFSNLPYFSSNQSDRKPLTLIGVVSASSLQNSSSFDGSTNIITASGNKTTGKIYKFDINPDHTHFIIYDDVSLNLTDNIGTLANLSDVPEQIYYDQFRNKIESYLTRTMGHYRREVFKLISDVSDDEGDLLNPKLENRQIPMVCLVIRGDLKSIDAIEYKIRKQIPVIILKGSGAVSDIISFAYEELSENKDPEYEDNFIKPEISKKLMEEFNEELSKNDMIRNQFRDKVISIVKSSFKGSQKFLTIVDMSGLGFKFLDLDKYILTALLQSQTQLSGKQGKAQLERNLRLTLDWNCPDLALSEIFQRDDYTQLEIKNNIFENAILRADREDFIELFLDQGFYVHRYLGRNNIRDLFTKADNREFFFTVVLQGVLGHFTNELPDNFFPDGLNEVLKELTSIEHMINILEIYMSQLGCYVTDVKKAEKKALNFLIIFAVLFNRHSLAKILWKRTEDPITIALICSLIYKNLLPYCQENYLKFELDKNQKDFANAAIGVLNMSFQENDPRSYSILTYNHPDWNGCTALDLAYNAKNYDFIAHPSCQKILTKRLFGAIQIRDIDGFIDFPAWFKVTLSAFLIFPMYYWIAFPTREVELNIKKKKKEANTTVTNMYDMDDDELADEEQQEAEQTKAELNKKLISEIKKNRKHSQLLLKNKDLDLNRMSIENPPSQWDLNQIKRSKYVTPPFYEKIYMIWSSPFTKFWLNFISYVVFLILFGLVTLWPCCGNLILDSVLWLWTATIIIEDTRIAYKNYLTGSQLPMTIPMIEISIMIAFLVLFFFVRILGTWDSLEFLGMDRIIVSKTVLCVFLLYFYYRTVFIFLPISHKLGPMLVKMKLMVKQDFMTYMRLFLIFMTAGGITLNAILYPFYPINMELFKRVIIYRGFIQLFVSDKADLETQTLECQRSNLTNQLSRPYSCVNLTEGLDFTYSDAKLREYGVSPKCNHVSLMAWIIIVQYFLLIKIFLPTLLFAMFGASSATVSSKSEQLWMYQRYEIVLDYEKRSMFPPPFNIILHTLTALKYVIQIIIRVCCTCKFCCSRFCFQHNKNLNDLNKTTNNNDQSDAQNTNNFTYWRSIAQRYSEESQKAAKEKAKEEKIDMNLNKVREDLKGQKKSLQRLNDRVITLEKSLILNQSYLEQIKNLITQKASKSGLLDRKKNNYIHILSRESPYVFTNIPRFFVYEKLVPWECPYELYDPPFIVIAYEALKVDKIFVDEEINQKAREETNTLQLTQQMSLGPPPPPILIKDPTQSPTGSHNVSLVNNIELPQGATQGATPSSPHLSFKMDETANQSDSQQPRTRKSSQQSIQQNKQNIFLWNAITTIENPFHVGKKISIDRKSWITRIDDQTSQSYPLIYSLDSMGYPRNPMGRTGVRGRGALNRYGPNHEIMAIVTRWKKQKNKPIYVERRKLLEFIAVKDPLTSLTKIPGQKIIGDESRYSVVCRTFMELVFEESDVEKGVNFTEEDMIAFFASFASKHPIINDKQTFMDTLNELGFVATMVYRGYIDDPLNTDNAWIEAEIWNFHYDKDDFLDTKLKNPGSKWREVSSNVRISSNEIIADVLKEISEIHHAFYN